MRKLIGKIGYFVDFCLCACFFPEAIGCLRLLKMKGFHSIAEKYFLYMVAKNIPLEGDILEIGSFMGSSAIMLAAGNEASRNKGIVWLIEPFPKPTKEKFLEVFRMAGFEKYVKLIEKTSEDAKNAIHAKFRFIFIDGNHDYEYVLKDILLWQEHLSAGGMIAFHDRTWPGVTKAVDELIGRSKNFTILGNISGIIYAIKGSFVNNDLLFRLHQFGNIRKSCIGIARKSGLKD